jgi:hypothetical protein
MKRFVEFVGEVDDKRQQMLDRQKQAVADAKLKRDRDTAAANDAAERGREASLSARQSGSRLNTQRTRLNTAGPRYDGD